MSTVQPPFDPWTTVAVASEIPWAGRAPPAWRAARSRQRLTRLLQHAQRHSRFWAERLQGVDASQVRLADLPVLTKPELMHRFDDAVCDRRIHLPELRRFLGDPSLIGQPFLDRYVVWESSGSSGEPAVFLQDAAAMAVYDGLEALRRPDAQRWLSPITAGETIVFLGATGGHFASTVSVERLRRLNPWMASRVHSVSFLQPVPRLLAQLDALAPSVLATYPTAAVLLADAASAGRLSIRPKAVWTGGETLTRAMREHVERCFGCVVHDSYGASECLTIAASCARGHLHLNDDWVLLEPVDEQGRPAPPGAFSHTVLLTNLANLAQPLIRYDLGDRVALEPGRCSCGSTLPVVKVLGRVDETLVVQGDDEQPVALLPLALCTVLEDEAGLFDFQVCCRGPRQLELRLGDEIGLGSDAAHKARQVLRHYLAQQGAAQVQIDLRLREAGERGRSGKVPRIVGTTRSGARS